MSGLTNVGADVIVMEECLGHNIYLYYSILAVMPSLSHTVSSLEALALWIGQYVPCG